MNKINTIIGFISVACGLMIIYLSRDMSMFDEYGVPGERFWPFGLALLFILLGVLQWINVIVDRVKHSASRVDLSSTAVRRAYGLSGLMILYTCALYYLGFIISTLLLIPIIMWIMNERRIKFLVVSSALIVLAVYVSFDIVFNSPLPIPAYLD